MLAYFQAERVFAVAVTISMSNYGGDLAAGALQNQ